MGFFYNDDESVLGLNAFDLIFLEVLSGTSCLIHWSNAQISIPRLNPNIQFYTFGTFSDRIYLAML